MSTIQNSSGLPATVEPRRVARAEGNSAAASPPATGTAAPPAARAQPPRVDFDPKKMQAELEEAIDKLNKQMEAGKRGLGFSVDDTLNLTVVTVKDANTGEVVRQIPSEAVLRVAHKIEELKGILYSKDV